jgi:hypothetical protein
MLCRNSLIWWDENFGSRSERRQLTGNDETFADPIMMVGFETGKTPLRNKSGQLSVFWYFFRTSLYPAQGEKKNKD